MDVHPDPLVTIDRIRAAARLLEGVATVSPLVPFTTPDGRSILLKAESLQGIGAFKIRGAYHAIVRLDEAVRARGVVAPSSGNHAQGVARAARLLGIPATIFMPANAATIKLERVRADGAEVITVDPDGPLSNQEAARRHAGERGQALIHSYDDDDVIAGQGTVGLEIAEALEGITAPGAVLVPIGGGGLISGVATALRALRPRIRIIGAEPALAADAQESFRGGHLVAWPAAKSRQTIADGARTNLSPRTFAHIRALVDDIVTVDEEEIAATIRLVAERARLVIEPSGALAVAAATFRSEEAGLAGVEGPVVALISGGNVDPERYVEYLRAPVPDR